MILHSTSAPSENTTLPSWTDDPIKSTSADLLHRSRFAEMVASRLNACEMNQPSTVFGLVGPWGSGKSSLLNLITEKLDSGWKVATCSPWAVPDSNGVASEFLFALSSTMEGDGQKVQAGKRALGKYLTVALPLLSLIPLGGTTVESLATKAVESFSERKPWHVEFEEASRVLEGLGHRVLIIADDIDRLDIAELMEFLKVVRLLGRFPNVHYLIAYDQSTVEDLLKSQGIQGRTSAFMEKIVQYPFEVPPIADVVKRRLLSETLNAFLEVGGIKFTEGDSARASELIAILAPALATPRAHARFREQLISYACAVSFDEVDALDMVALSYLRIFHHDVFTVIPTWKKALQSGVWRLAGLTRRMGDAEWTEELKPLIQHQDAAAPHMVLSFLFPGVSYNGHSYNSSHELALSNDSYFQRFFILGIAEDDVEDSFVAAAIDDILGQRPTSSDSAQYAKLLDVGDGQMAALAYEKGENLRRSADGSAAMVKFLLQRISARSEEDTSFMSASRVMWRWFNREVQSAWAEDLVTRAELIDWLGDDLTIRMLVLMSPETGISENESNGLLNEFADYYRGEVASNFSHLLSETGRLRNVLTFLTGVGGNDAIDAILDAPVGESSELFLDVIEALVVTTSWDGEPLPNSKLWLNTSLLEHSFSDEMKAKLLPTLPDSRSMGELKNEGAVDVTAREVGVAGAKTIAFDGIRLVDARSQSFR